MYSCKSCDRDPCEGRHREFCKFNPDNRLVDFGPGGGDNYWIKKKSSIIVTSAMIEDLLHRNDVDIKNAEKRIERMHEDIEKEEEFIKQLLKARAGLFKALEGMETK